MNQAFQGARLPEVPQQALFQSINSAWQSLPTLIERADRLMEEFEAQKEEI
jgi:hypothetical protein